MSQDAYFWNPSCRAFGGGSSMRPVSFCARSGRKNERRVSRRLEGVPTGALRLMPCWFFDVVRSKVVNLMALRVTVLK